MGSSGRRLAAALAVVAGLGTAPTIAAARPSVGAPGPHFIPATGDWEGVAGGFPASFQLVYHPRNARYGPRYSSYSYENLVRLLPSGCPVDPSQHSESTIAGDSLALIAASGSFRARPFGVRGGLTGARTAKLSSVFRIPGFGSNAGCSGVLTWHMHPARRRRVRSGTWRLRFSDGESESFKVSAGGRLASGIGFPNGFDCALGGVDLFVGADGVGAWTDGSTHVTLRFAAATASGQMTGTDSGSGCNLAMTARRTSA